MAFLGTFIKYVIELVILAALGVGGIFLGRSLRMKKDAKTAAEASGSAKE